MIDKSKYVVLDVETNGLSSMRDDLLSISLYRPDTEDFYSRFLPLELQKDVYTTYINGIKKRDLKDKTPLTQSEVDELIQRFELDKRIVLTYGSLDERFIKNYFIRKRLFGYEKMKFYNFKHDIISSRFSEGNITKDNLCMLFGIEGVQDVHTGENDCLLEWKLFEKLDGRRLLITHNRVFEFNEDYIIPASYLSNYPNMKYHIKDFPKISVETEEVKEFIVVGKNIKKFPTNFNGMVIEHLINSMLGVKKIDSREFLLENKRKLRCFGELESEVEEVLIVENADGTVSAVNEKDKKLIAELNAFITTLKENLEPMITYLQNEIFKDEQVYSQELVVNREQNVLALCDLSNSNAVVEIKTYGVLDMDQYKEQIYFQGNGRDVYVLQAVWGTKKVKLYFRLVKVIFSESAKKGMNDLEARTEAFKKKVPNENLEVIRYSNYESPVTLGCKICGHQWELSYKAATYKPKCPICNPVVVKKPKIKAVESESREEKYKKKISEKSNGKLEILDYFGSKEKAKVKCIICQHEWEYRADHLFERCRCPRCK